MPMVTKLNFKLCVLSSVSMRGTHDCATDSNSVLGYSIKPILLDLMRLVILEPWTWSQLDAVSGGKERKQLCLSFWKSLKTA